MNVLNESTNKLQGNLTFQNYEQKKEFFPLEQAPLLLENEEEEEEEEEEKKNRNGGVDEKWWAPKK